MNRAPRAFLLVLAIGLASACSSDPTAVGGALGGLGSKAEPTSTSKVEPTQRVITPTDGQAKTIPTPIPQAKPIPTPIPDAKPIPTPIPKTAPIPIPIP